MFRLLANCNRRDEWNNRNQMTAPDTSQNQLRGDRSGRRRWRRGLDLIDTHIVDVFRSLSSARARSRLLFAPSLLAPHRTVLYHIV